MNNLSKFHNSREYADSMKPLNDKRFANSRFKTGPLHSKEFNISHSTGIHCMELSHDETFFVTGGYYENKENVLKLSMRDVFGIQTELKPNVIHNVQYSTGTNFVLCLAISPDDRRIISGSFSGKVLVHDIQRSQLLHDIRPQNDNDVWGISVQPSSHNGDVFASGNISDGILSIFDFRSSTTAAVIEREEGKGINSVSFSPEDTTHVALAGWYSAKIIDIRQPNQDLLLLSTDWCNGIRYNSKGDRLIFIENAAGPQVVDLASFISGGENEGKKKLTSTVEMDHNWTEQGVCCFAGANDELVVAASRRGDLHVWSVPEGRFNRSTIHRQTMHLTFDDQEISGVFYSKHRSTLVSSGGFNHIKTWTAFKLPQLPTQNHM